MPFGAEVRDDRRVRFRLWAPSQPAVQLVLQDSGGQQALPMLAAEGGWFEIVTDRAGVGTRYGFLLDNDLRVPDPASRYQPDDVHGLSEVIDPRQYAWRDGNWAGRAWEEAVLYELHVGTFTPEGNFRAVIGKLDYLVDLGVTAIELMPVADFPGNGNWGYDGVYPFAPDSRYGRPEDLKALVDAAHACGLMVILDVVYNHFGPEGNYLHEYARDFFTDRHQTPWGAAINFDDTGSRTVRDFFVHNALYWIEEYHFDGLRLDAVHAIVDDSKPDILQELAQAVHEGPGRRRPVHLILENDNNQARYLARRDGGAPPAYVAQWNDDIHHALHVLITGERDGYYEDYADDPLRYLGRSLAEGFSYQGEPSRHRYGTARGEPSAHLPPTAFINFIQTHDQVGNRAFGERIASLSDREALHAAMAILLLAPSPPMLFMGEEWGSMRPFQFFCDFGPELANAVTEGRRREFARFPAFSDPARRARIPDPNDPATFAAVVLDWSEREREPHRTWLALCRELLAIRRREIVTLLARIAGGQARYRVLDRQGLDVQWTVRPGERLTLLANLSRESMRVTGAPPGRCIYTNATDHGVDLPPWGVMWFAEGTP